MDRRSFLKTTGSVAVVATATMAPALGAESAAGKPAAAPAINTGPGTLTIGTDAPDIARGLAEDLRRLCLTLNEVTRGEVNIRFTQGLSRTDADVWFGPASGLATDDPALGYFEGLPGDHAMDAGHLAQWIAFGGGQMLWDDLAAAHGYKALLAAHSGSPGVLWSTSPITAPSQFRKLRVVASGLSNGVVKGLGGQCLEAAPCASASLLTAGSADAIEFGGAMHGLAHGIAATSKFAVAGAIARHGAAYALQIKQRVWDALPPSNQLALTMAASNAYQESVSEARLHDRIARDVIARRHGIAFTVPGKELEQTIAAVSDAVVAHAAGSSRAARRINASYTAFKVQLGERTAPVA